MLDSILIVDGDVAQSSLLGRAINEKLKYKTQAITSGREAIEMVLAADCVPSIMLLDMRVLQIDAIHVIGTIKYHKPDFPIIIIIEYGDTSHAVEAIKAGANDFLTKPVTIERLGLSIASALRTRYLCKMIEKLEKQLEMDGVSSNQSSQYVANAPLLASDSKVRKLRHLEEDAIRHALNTYGGSMSKAARSLGIGRSTLYRKVSELERYKIKSDHISRENQTTRPTMVKSDIGRSYIE